MLEKRAVRRISDTAVPRHGTLKRGTLRSLLRATEISVDEFVSALDR